jgi:hypothetical protein
MPQIPRFQKPSSKQTQAALTEDPNPNSQIPTMAEKPRDLEDRTFEFAQAVRGFVKQLPRTLANN